MPQRRMRPWLVFLLVLAFSVCRASSPNPHDKKDLSQAEGQTQQEQTPLPQAQSQQVYESSTVLRATTRLVVVDVVATNGKGDPITDLKAEDFTLLEDGKEQKVRSFSFQQPIRLAGSKASAHQLPPNVFTNVPAYRTTSALNVVLLDALNTTLPNQAYARHEMIRYLEKLPEEGQPVAVYMLGRKLQLLQDFTSDPSVLKNVVRKLKIESSPLLDNPSGSPDQQMGGSFFGDLVPSQMQQSMQRFEQERTSVQATMRVQATMDAMAALSRSLAGYPGRKNLIWISEGFPLNIDPDLTLSGDAFASSRSFNAEVAEIAESLIDAQIAIYPVDARGLTAPSFFSAENSGRGRNGRALRGPDLQSTLSAESSLLFAVHGTMQEVADRTGGKAFYNRNDLDSAIRKSIADGSTYYTLAYYPENKDWNGKFRKIHLKVNRSGVKLRHRQGYYATDPKLFSNQNRQQQAAAFSQALSLDYPVSTGLRFEAGVIMPSEKTHNQALVNFALDPHAISFEHADGLQHASVDCAVRVYSEKGKLLKTAGTTIQADLKPDTFRRVMQSAVPCQQYVELPAGSYLLRLGVRDNRTGLIGTANGRVTVATSALPADVKPDEKKP